VAVATFVMLSVGLHVPTKDFPHLNMVKKLKSASHQKLKATVKKTKLRFRVIRAKFSCDV
jgi:hypothetical protein